MICRFNYGVYACFLRLIFNFDVNDLFDDYGVHAGFPRLIFDFDVLKVKDEDETQKIH